MILSDRDIKRWAINGGLDPYDEKQVQPASIDLKLGNGFKYIEGKLNKNLFFNNLSETIDPTKPNTYKFEYRDYSAINHLVLPSGGFAIGCTAEKVNIPSTFVARVEGKSSLARLGLIVHTTAGFIDPGFKGSITLEFVNCSPRDILLTSGMDICQLALEELSSMPDKLYAGRYQNAEGTEASKYAQPIGENK